MIQWQLQLLDILTLKTRGLDYDCMHRPPDDSGHQDTHESKATQQTLKYVVLCCIFVIQTFCLSIFYLLLEVLFFKYF